MDEMNYYPDMEINISEHYTPNKDYGHNLADMVLIQKEFDERATYNEFFNEGFNKNKVIEILNHSSANRIFNSSKQKSLLKGVLGRLEREANMDLGYSSDMSNSQMLILYNKARRIAGIL
jgi:hypothetical protein